jgi:hypothetical protein
LKADMLASYTKRTGAAPNSEVPMGLTGHGWHF